MADVIKALWIAASVLLMMIYAVGALYIDDNITAKEKYLTKQVMLYDSRKRALSRQKMDLIALQDSLLSQLSDEKSIEQKKVLSIHLENKKREEKRQEQIEEQRRIQEEQSRLEEMRRDEEIRRKSRRRRRSRAS